MTDSLTFPEAVPEELTCSICMKVLWEPHLMNCCEQQFCKTCLEKWLQDHNACPHCRSTNFSHILMQQVWRKVKELKVYCPNKQQGCMEVLRFGECKEHLSTANGRGCLYVKLECPNHCSAEIFRGAMEAHTEDECPRRSIPCPHCGLEGEYQHIVGVHEGECPMFPLPCPLGCDSMVPRQDLATHHDTCPLEPVPCPFRDLGCESRVCRQELQRHVESSVLQHLAGLAQSHATLQAENAALRAEHVAFLQKHSKLAQSFNALQLEHKALSEDYVASKKSFSAKLEMVEPLVRSLSLTPGGLQINQIYSLLRDASTLPEEGSVNVVISKRSGHHDITLSAFQPELKLRLEWEVLQAEGEMAGAGREASARGASHSYEFKLYSVTEFADYPEKLTLDAMIWFSPSHEGASNGVDEKVDSESVRIATICCGTPQHMKQFQAVRLLGRAFLSCQHEEIKEVVVSVGKHKRIGCRCLCHLLARRKPSCSPGANQPYQRRT